MSSIAIKRVKRDEYERTHMHFSATKINRQFLSNCRLVITTFLLILFSDHIVFSQTTSLVVNDTRSVISTPLSYSQSVVSNFKLASALGLPSVGVGFYTTLGLRGWYDNTGGKAHELAFSDDSKIFFRSGLSPTWESWRQLLLSDANGDVGIGTTSPLDKLHVNGKLRIGSSTDYAYSGQDVSGTFLEQVGTTVSKSKIRFQLSKSGDQTNYSNLTIDPYNGFLFNTTGNANGNVGIGTSNPLGKLDVNGAILLPGSTDNNMPRPAVGTTRITGEIAGYRGSSFDDGFLRLSAGGGTNVIGKTFIDLSGYSILPDMDRNITFGTSGVERIRVTSSGYVGIGTTTPKEALSVNGDIRSKQIKVETANWPDYVFKPEYDLSSLAEVNTYIKQNHRLPEMPSEQEVAKNGINLGEVVKVQTKKIEELTLYLIEKDKQVNNLQNEMERLKQQLNTLIRTVTKK